MTFDELQGRWHKSTTGSTLTLQADTLLREVKRNKEHLALTILWRDTREVIAGTAVAAIFAYLGLRGAHWEMLLLALAAAGVVVFLLADRAIQRARQPQTTDTLAGYIESSLSQVNHQIWLLKNVLWWYLLPLFVGIVIFVSRIAWAARGDKAVAIFLGGYFVLCGLLYAGIYLLNQSAVRKTLIPRRDELESLLQSLVNDGPGTP